MQPKVLCASCSAELRLGDKFCGKCGESVDWQPSGKQSSQRPSHAEPKKAPPATNSWKLVAGFFAVLLVVIAGVEFMKKPAVVPVAQTAPMQSPGAVAAEPQGPNMAAVVQLNEMEAQVKSFPGNMQLLLQLANAQHDNRFWDKAVISYKSYLSKNPKDPNARVDLGICYKELGNLEEAKKEMKAALKYEPKHLFAHFNLGIVLLSEGSLEESNEWFKKTVALAPNSELGKKAQQMLSQHSSMNFKPMQ